MKHLHVSWLSALALGTSLVQAADLPVKAPIVTAPIAVPTWAGCYIGGNAGGAWVYKRWTDVTVFSR